jgi:hypothetical protein
VGWSVVLKGVTEEVSTSTTSRLRCASIPYSRSHQSRQRWIAVYPAEITGRRFRLD